MWLGEDDDGEFRRHAEDYFLPRKYAAASSWYPMKRTRATRSVSQTLYARRSP